MKRSKGLTAFEIDRLKPKDGKETITKRDSQGLYIRVSRNGSKSWIFRYSFAGKARNPGLGAYPGVGIAAARNLAEEWRAKLKGPDPVDPWVEREKKLAAERAAGEQ